MQNLFDLEMFNYAISIISQSCAIKNDDVTSNIGNIIKHDLININAKHSISTIITFKNPFFNNFCERHQSLDVLLCVMLLIQESIAC